MNIYNNLVTIHNSSVTIYKISFEAGYSRNTVRTYDKLAVCVELLQSAADVTAAVCVPVSLRSGSQHDDGV